MPCSTMAGLRDLVPSDQTPVASAEPWENIGNICCPFDLVYHLEKAGPSTVQADATATAISEEIFSCYMCKHFSAACPSVVPTLSKNQPKHCP